MVKDLAIFCLSPIYHFWDFFCDFCNFCEFFCIFLYFWGALFCIFYVFNNEVFCVHFSLIFCVFSLCFCVHFLNFLLPPIVEVDISDIAKISGITNVVKTIILVINNNPQKTYRIAQYTVAWYRLLSLITRSERRASLFPSGKPL